MLIILSSKSVPSGTVPPRNLSLKLSFLLWFIYNNNINGSVDNGVIFFTETAFCAIILPVMLTISNANIPLIGFVENPDIIILCKYIPELAIVTELPFGKVLPLLVLI
jgi:hypothetical protein